MLSMTVLSGALAVLLLVILYNISNVFRYFFRYIVFIILSLISATIFIPLMLFKPGDWRNALYPAWGARQTAKLLGIKFNVIGLENAVEGSGSVVLINHQSAIDLFVLAEIWPRLDRCTVISKKEVFYLWPFGLATWLWGTIFIDRVNGEKAQATINKTGETIRKKKARVLMFPEGTRHGGANLLPFKKGAFHVAISSQVPIQPVVVSRYWFLDHEHKIFNGGNATIKILPPISTEGLSREDLPKLIEDTHSIMSQAYTKLTEEVTSRSGYSKRSN